MKSKKSLVHVSWTARRHSYADFLILKAGIADEDVVDYVQKRLEFRARSIKVKLITSKPSEVAIMQNILAAMGSDPRSNNLFRKLANREKWTDIASFDRNWFQTT